jgi:DNA-binding CsgD family transcriptional regulator
MAEPKTITWCSACKQLFLSLHAVRERLARLEAKLGVRTAADAVARALRESA